MKNDLTAGNDLPNWILSTYGPGKNAPASLLDGNELSFEELRLRFYELKAAGNEAQATNEANGLWSKAEQQIADIVNNADKVVAFMQEAEKKHPNRFDFLKMTGTTSKEQVIKEAQSSTPFGGVFGAKSSGFGAPTTGFGTGFGGTPPTGPDTSMASATSAGAFGQPAQPSGFGDPSFGKPSQPAFGQSAFGQTSTTSAFGKPGGGAFGQPSTLGQMSQFGASGFGQQAAKNPFAAPSAATFGQPSQPAGGFGQPSKLGGFGQANQQTTGFGQHSQLGGGFGQSAKPTGEFGQPSQPTPGFGQPSQPAPGFGAGSNPFSGFGQPAKPAAGFGQAQQPASGFGQPSQPVSTFGQPAQQKTANLAVPAFGQPLASQAANAKPSNPFGGGGTITSSTTPGNPFGEPAQPSNTNPPNPFLQTTPSASSSASTLINNSPTPPPSYSSLAPIATANNTIIPRATTTTTSGTTSNISHPLTSKPPAPTHYTQTLPSSQTQINPQTNRLTSYKSRRVQYINDAPCYDRPDGRGWERIWFPDVKSAEVRVEDVVPAEEGRYDDSVKGAYRVLAEKGAFELGAMPRLPPRREWVGFDF